MLSSGDRHRSLRGRGLLTPADSCRHPWGFDAMGSALTLAIHVLPNLLASRGACVPALPPPSRLFPLTCVLLGSPGRLARNRLPDRILARPAVLPVAADAGHLALVLAAGAADAPGPTWRWSLLELIVSHVLEIHLRFLSAESGVFLSPTFRVLFPLRVKPSTPRTVGFR